MPDLLTSIHSNARYTFSNVDVSSIPRRFLSASCSSGFASAKADFYRACMCGRLSVLVYT